MKAFQAGNNTNGEEKVFLCVKLQSLQTIAAKVVFFCMHKSFTFTEDLTILVC